MPDVTKPIDDNTLFILLALSKTGYIKISDITAIYDWNVNYENTAIITDSVSNDIQEIGNAGIDYVVDNYGVAKEENAGQIVLRVAHKEHITNFLAEYLKHFPHDTVFYYSEEKHRNRLYEFIKSEEPDVCKFEGKYFTYKFLPKNNREKYKMIEYLAVLIAKGFLIADDYTFEFYTENGTKEKSIRLKFASKLKLEELFIDKFNEEKRQEILKELRNQKPEMESKKWIIYKDYIVYKPLRITGKMTNRYKKLLKYCIRENLEQITACEYAAYNKCTEQTAKGYFADIHRDIQKGLKTDNIKIFTPSGEEGKWRVDI